MLQLLLLIGCADDKPCPCDTAAPEETGAPDSAETGETAVTTETGDTAETADTSEPISTTLDVYVLAGQSNMDGWGYVTGLPPSLQVGQPDVRLYWSGNGAWTDLQPASYGIAYGYDVFGPEVTFGRFLADLDPSQPVALIKHAVGGTALYDYWYPGTSRYDTSQGAGYRDLLATIDAATAELDAEGQDWRFAGFLWMQGESDAFYTEEIAEAYEQNLESFVARVRADLDAPELPFVLGRIHCSTCVYPDIVREGQQAVADSDPLVYAFDTDDLPINADNIHYDAPGMRALGERFAQALLDLPLSESAQPAILITGSFSTLYTGDFLLGYEFETDRTILLTDLGTLDYGLDGLVLPSQVAIWEADSGSLVARATVPSMYSALSTPWNAFRFVAIEPVSLPAGRYVIGSQVYNGSTDRYVHDATVTAADGVTWVESRYNSGTVVSQPVTPYDNPVSWLGPNFLFLEE